MPKELSYIVFLCLRYFITANLFLREALVVRLKAEIMDCGAVARAMKRIAHEILEKNGGCKDIYFVGIKRGGIPLAHILSNNIYEIEGVRIPVGIIDTVPHRDDRRNIPVPQISTSDIPFDISGKKVIMVDDVLYTGRTVRAAMEALISYGRPSGIQLAVLIDRGHRELPIRGDYVGKNIPTSRSEIIKVEIQAEEGKMSVGLYEI